MQTAGLDAGGRAALLDLLLSEDIRIDGATADEPVATPVLAATSSVKARAAKRAAAKKAAAKKPADKKKPAAKKAATKKTTSKRTSRKSAKSGSEYVEIEVPGSLRKDANGKTILPDIDDAVFEKDLAEDPTLKEDEKEGFVLSAADEADEPEQQVMVAGATADPVKDYLKQIGKVPLLNAGQEVEL
ncbi:MAG TPA: sigma-70 factor domain-containing protein, partial [Nocardioidaceae bacterium]|nr:sigma-70 factor domain-containing protein [Nocardioidaceae bacterium]